MAKRQKTALPSDADAVLSPAKERPFVYDDGKEISLRFDIRAVQSAMDKRAPFELVFSYSRMMMGFLLFQPAPRDILIIGLGGGSLSKYCYRHLPEAHITTVEINEDVIALRDRFEIPPDDERFVVVHGDGAEYMADCHGSADVIMLDGYVADGLPQELISQYFFNRCASALREGGVLVANVDEASRQVELCSARLRKSFGGKVLRAKSDRGYNQIVYALKHDEMPDWQAFRDRAVALEAQHKLNFRSMAAKLQASLRANPGLGLPAAP